MNLMKYKTEIELFSSYFDANDNISAKSVLNIFQDVASVHGEIIGVGFKTMLEKNLYWVISRVKFDIIKKPQPNQKVIVETWPHEKGRIDFDRDMKVTSETGEILIIGTQKWCVINSQSRALERTDNVVYNGECPNDINYPEKFAKLTVPSTPLTKRFTHKVRFSDLDHNKHMNNTSYATLVQNAAENKDFSHFEINYLNECVLDDEIEISSTKTTEGEYITGTNNGKTAFTAFIK